MKLVPSPQFSGECVAFLGNLVSTVLVYQSACAVVVVVACRVVSAMYNIQSMCRRCGNDEDVRRSWREFRLTVFTQH